MAKARMRKKKSKKSSKKSWLTKTKEKLKDWWNRSLSAWGDWTLTTIDKMYWY